MRVLTVAGVAQVLLVALVPSAWLVPDLIVVGLVLVLARTPERWWTLSGFAGLWAMVWAIRFPLPIFLSYLGVGWIVQVIARRWDLSDVWIRSGVAGLAGLVTTAGLLWVESLGSIPLLGLAAARVTLTSLVVPVVDRLLPRFSNSQTRPPQVG